VTRPSNFLGRTPRLWSPISSQEEEEDDDDIMLLNFSHEKPASTTTREVQASNAAGTPSERSREMDLLASTLNVAIERSTEGMSGFSTGRRQTPESGQLGPGPGGLWGGTSPPDEADQIRDRSASKRRWTVSERS
jgi:hypothetical protein